MFALLFFAFADLSMDYDSLNLYLYPKVYEVKDQYLFVGSMEHALVLVDRDGSVVNEYRHSGKGPKELFMPKVLKANDQEIWVISNRKHLLVFDAGLNLMRTERAGFLNERAYIHGFEKDQSFFLITSFGGMTDYLLYGFKESDGEIREDFRAFPQKKVERRKVTDALSLAYHQGYFFKYHGSISDHYEIDVVVNLPEDQMDGDIVMTLAGDVSEYMNTYPGRTYQAYISTVYKLEKGFLVALSARTKPFSEDKNLTEFVDVFGADGGFLRREQLDVPLIGCRNCPDVFVVRDTSEGERLVRYRPFKSSQP